MSDPREDNTIYRVVVNGQEQYSIWPQHLGVPHGWSPVRKVGSKKDCLDYIAEVSTDIRPLSWRKMMEQQGGR